MKTINDYRAETLIILGDTAGRRYSEAILDTAIRQALEMLRKYLPNKDTEEAAVGDLLSLELGMPHRIKDLDGSTTTTVPEDLLLTVCTGAAGYALQIRARSVTEVFGKRPEDTDKLLREGRHLETQFIAAIDFAAFAASLHRDPWPGPGFPI